MSDITMCVSMSCPIKLSCYRFTAKTSDWQSMADFSDQVTKGLNGYECKMFWPLYKITGSNQT